MKVLPNIGAKCVARVNEILSIAATTEGLWLAAPPASEVKKNLKVAQLEALYEATYLRIFATFESFVEDALSHYMAGYATPHYSPHPAPNKGLHATIASARAELYHGKRYLLWHDMSRDVKRAQDHLSGCPVETAITANLTRLESYAAVRHHIAHNSADSRRQFESAALSLTGSAHDGKPGKMLRSEDISDPLNTPKRIRLVVDDLARTILGISP